MSIEIAYQRIADQIPSNVALVAVSKTKPSALIEQVYALGQRDFGENKVQELCQKAEELSELDIRWHMIGHLQRNKVKYIAPFVYLIHGVDSFRLLQEIDKQGKRLNRVIDCLLQFHIATESTKFGLLLEEARMFLSSPEFSAFTHARVVGVMGMASFTSNQDQIKTEFKSLKDIFETLYQDYFNASETPFQIISMGMSGDFQLAIEQGSTMVRVGSSIFGSR